MTVNHWVVRVALVVLFPALPACVMTAKQTVPEPTPVATITTEFSVLPRVPGERLPLHHPEPGPQPATKLDPVEPDSVEIQPPAPKAFPLDPVPHPVVESVVPDPPLIAAVRAYHDNRPDLALEHLRGLDKPNQELMLQLIPALVQASRMNLTQPSSVDVGLLVTQLQAADSPLAGLTAKAPIFVEKLVFCREVRGFGRYVPFEDQATLKAGQTVWLYVELRNTPSIRTVTPTDGVVFETAFGCTLQIQDATGGVVELFDGQSGKMVPKLQDTKRDLTRSSLRDYFIAFQFPVPVKPGEYAVSIGVHHGASHRAVSRTMRFRAQ